MEQNKIVTYYVIKDLATWTTRGCKQSVCERYEHAEEAMALTAVLKCLL